MPDLAAEWERATPVAASEWDRAVPVKRDLAAEWDAASPVSAGEAFRSGATRGVLDRILARAQALGAQGSTDPGVQGRSMAEQLVNPQEPVRPVDESRMEADRARFLSERRAAGARAQAAHSGMYLAGEMVPALASAAIPGAGSVQGAAMVGAGLGLSGSESDTASGLAGDAAMSGAIAGGGAKLAQLAGRGLSAVGQKLLPRAVALRESIATKIADRSAAAAESTARSATGTLGAATAGGSADMKLLQALHEMGVSPETTRQIEEALAGPQAADLREALASRALDRLPGKLGQIESAQALASQTAEEAAAARSPEAVSAMEQQMRGEVTRRLLTRYVLPAAGGAALGEYAGGHQGGALGFAAGLNSRPMVRAMLRGITSPGFAAPASRALAAGAEGLAGLTGNQAGRAAVALEPEAESQITMLAKAIRARLAGKAVDDLGFMPTGVKQ